MKVVIATAVYYPMINGVAVFSHNLAVGLAARGHEVLVICPSQTKKYHVEIQDGVKVCYLKSTTVKVYPDQIHDVAPKKKAFGRELPRVFYKHGLKVSAFPAKRVKKILTEFQPDVVHVQVSDPIGLSVVSYAKKHDIPVVTTEHNQPEVFTEPLHVPGLVKKPIDALLSAYFYNRQTKSDYVTMPTRQAIDNLILSRGKDFKVPFEAVSNGVDLSRFKSGKATDSIYDKYGIPKDRPIVLYVGRVDPEKKVGLVVGAFVKMLSRNNLDSLSNTFCLVIGDGVDRLRLEKEFSSDVKKGNVKFLGRVTGEDLYELYKVGSLFATASEIETQGIVLIEAAATGLPLIAVKAGAVAEVCQNNVNGFLCEPGDENGISAAMEKILSDDELRKEFSKKSIEIAHEHDFEKTLDKFENIYRQVIDIKNNK